MTVYVGLTYDINKRNQQHFSDNYKSSLKEYLDENNGVTYELKNLLDNYVSIDEAQYYEIFFISEYRKNGWNIINRNKGGGLGGNEVKWNKKSCINEALKYEYKYDFCKKSKGAYASAKRNNWIDEICSHMKIKNRRLSKEECLNIFLKHKTPKEFRENSKSVYEKVRLSGWLEEFTKVSKELARTD